MLEHRRDLLREQLDGANAGQCRPMPVGRFVEYERRDEHSARAAQRNEEGIVRRPVRIVTRFERACQPSTKFGDHPRIPAVEVIRVADPESLDQRQPALPDVARDRRRAEPRVVLRRKPRRDDRGGVQVRIAQRDCDAAESDAPNRLHEHNELRRHRRRSLDVTQCLVQQKEMVALLLELMHRLERKPARQYRGVAASILRHAHEPVTLHPRDRRQR